MKIGDFNEISRFPRFYTFSWFSPCRRTSISPYEFLNFFAAKLTGVDVSLRTHSPRVWSRQFAIGSRPHPTSNALSLRTISYHSHHSQCGVSHQSGQQRPPYQVPPPTNPAPQLQAHSHPNPLRHPFHFQKHDRA